MIKKTPIKTRNAFNPYNSAVISLIYFFQGRSLLTRD